MVHRCDSQNSKPSCLTAETKKKLDRLAELAGKDPAIMQAINQAIATNELLEIQSLNSDELNHLQIILGRKPNAH